MKRVIKIVTLLIALIGFAFGAHTEPTFKIKTITGKELQFRGTDEGIVTSPYEGKVVFIEFWGTWCGPCLLSIPHHVALQEKYKDKLRIVAIETTPTVTKKELLQFIQNPAKGIDMSKVDWFLKNKARTPQAKAYFKKPIEELEKFRKSGKKINYDVISSQDGAPLINYIAKRADWQGSIPFLIIFKPDGSVSNILTGMISDDELQRAYNNAIKKRANTPPQSK